MTYYYYPNNPSLYHLNYDGQTNSNYNCLQEKLLLNKQKVSLIQDQNASNTIMCRILSELENLVINFSYPGKKYFGYYATIPSNYQDIIDQIVIQMKIFESSYKNFRKNNPNGNYIFPNNLQYAKIIDIVNGWKDYLRKKSDETNERIYIDVLKYYDEFTYILSNHDLSKSFKKEFENLGKDRPPISQNELRRIMNAGATAACYMNEKFSDIEDEIAKKGDYKINVVLAGDRKDNKFYNNLDKYDHKLTNFKKQLYENLNLMLAYLEIYAILKSGPNKKIQSKYSNIINNDNNKNNIEKVYDNYIKYLNDFYEKYNLNEFDYKLEPQEIKTIADDINSWKINITDFNAKEVLETAINNLKNLKNEEYNNKYFH